MWIMVVYVFIVFVCESIVIAIGLVLDRLYPPSIPESSSMKRNDPTHRTIEKNVTLISPSIIDPLRTQSIASTMNA
jgi:hypothetical protein